MLWLSPSEEAWNYQAAQLDSGEDICCGGVEVKNGGTETAKSDDLQIGADSASRELVPGSIVVGVGFSENPQGGRVLLGVRESLSDPCWGAVREDGTVGVGRDGNLDHGVGREGQGSGEAEQENGLGRSLAELELGKGLG